MKSATESFYVGYVTIFLITLIEVTMCLFVSFKSRNASHPFFYLQKINFAFYITIRILLVVTGLNSLAALLLAFDFGRVQWKCLRVALLRLFVISLLTFFHITCAIFLLILFVILETKSIEYFSIKKYKTDENIQGFIDSSQKTLTCCGKTNGVRDWNGSVPSSCCDDKSCSEYLQNWPCFPFFNFILGSPLLISSLVIFVIICFNAICLRANNKYGQFFFSTVEDKKTEKPAVHPKPLPPPPTSPCYMTHLEDGKPPLAELSCLDMKGKRRKSSSAEPNLTFKEEEAILDARRGSGYRKFGSDRHVINKICDAEVKRRVCFSLPTDRRKKSTTKDDVNKVLSLDLQNVMIERCISPKYLKKSLSEEDMNSRKQSEQFINDPIKIQNETIVSKQSEAETKPTPGPEETQRSEKVKPILKSKIKEASAETVKEPEHRERSLSPFSALLAKRKRRRKSDGR